jgi:hypothetical protein
MPVFCKINIDELYQVNEKVRISGAETFETLDTLAYSKVEISPDITGIYYDLGADVLSDKSLWFLDWSYGSAGVYQVGVKLTEGLNVHIFTKDITILTEAQDKLFSDDSDLISYQNDIMKYLPESRSSWNFVIRRAQEEILSWIDEKGFVNSDQTKVTKDQILDVSEVKDLSIFKSLRIIYSSLSNALDDFFQKKATFWEAYEKRAELRCVLRLDTSKTGDAGSQEVINQTTIYARRT